MTEAGILRGGAALVVPPQAGTTSAPSAPSGYLIIDPATAREAAAWAQKAPSRAHGGNTIASAHVPMPGK